MDTAITRIDLPDWSLMAGAATPPGTYADCDHVDVPGAVDLPAYIAAFYDTRLFRAERMILSVALRQRIGRPEVAALAQGRADAFAAWTVSERTADQIWLTDVTGATMSWLAVRPATEGTRLYFGSVVVARGGRLPMLARALMPLHRLYARGLLGAAARALR